MAIKIRHKIKPRLNKKLHINGSYPKNGEIYFDLNLLQNVNFIKSPHSRHTSFSTKILYYIQNILKFDIDR